MILNAREDLFRFNLPKGFIPGTIQDKYFDYIKRTNLPFETISDLVNYSITGLNFPGISVEPVIQTLPGFDEDGKRGRQITYRSAKSKEDILDTKTLTINFALLDGFINYWVLLETFWYYYEYSNKDHYTLDLPLVFLDSSGIVTGQAIFKFCIPTKLSDLTLSFSNPSTERKEFTLDLEFIELKIDLEQKIGNKKYKTK